jgi:hypothetical protein
MGGERLDVAARNTPRGLEGENDGAEEGRARVLKIVKCFKEKLDTLKSCSCRDGCGWEEEASLSALGFLYFRISDVTACDGHPYSRSRDASDLMR